MCGIFGIINKNTPVNSDRLIRVSELLKHRGPDDEGFLLSSVGDNQVYAFKGDSSSANLNLPHIKSAKIPYNVALLHRRLSILDLSNAGHQPMSYDNERYWITLNGEIYNYIEIKKELKQKGYIFMSNTDTEVVLAAYIEWGKHCVKQFNGMWAFAIWDSYKNELFLSRDRLGIKPLYYSFFENSFIFSSEIKGILTYIKQKPSFNKNKIREYLIKGQVLVGESETTIFEGIKQLMPASNLVFSNNEYIISKYWNIELKTSKKSRKEHIKKFTELFDDSLRLRMRSDVEVGSCLSGGIDSSSIVSYASKKFGIKFNTFSAIWRGTRHDEYKYMKLVNDYCDAKPNYIESDTTNIIKLIDDITWHQENPIAGSSLIAQWEVMRKARMEGIPVLLDGQGADEILSGYPVYLIPYINEMIAKGKIGELQKFITNSKYHSYSFIKILKLQIKKYLKKQENLPLLPISNKEYKKYKNGLKYKRPIDAKSLPHYLKEHIEKSNLPSLLHFEDRNSMAHSIEARVPFLDYRLLEYCLNIPSEHKIGEGFTKTILRDAMKDFVPYEVFMRRDKIGFSTPIEEQLSNKKSALYDYMDNYLKKSALWDSDFIDKDKYEDKHLFALYSLQRFFDIYSK